MSETPSPNDIPFQFKEPITSLDELCPFHDSVPLIMYDTFNAMYEMLEALKFNQSYMTNEDDGAFIHFHHLPFKVNVDLVNSNGLLFTFELEDGIKVNVHRRSDGLLTISINHRVWGVDFWMQGAYVQMTFHVTDNLSIGSKTSVQKSVTVSKLDKNNTPITPGQRHSHSVSFIHTHSYRGSVGYSQSTHFTHNVSSSMQTDETYMDDVRATKATTTFKASSLTLNKMLQGVLIYDETTRPQHLHMLLLSIARQTTQIYEDAEEYVKLLVAGIEEVRDRQVA